MNFNSLALVSSFAVFSVVSLTSQALAQNTMPRDAIVDFTGTISPTVSVGGGNGIGAEPVVNPPLNQFRDLIALSNTLSLSSNANIIFTITSIVDNASSLSGGKTYNNIDFVGAEIKDGLNSIARAETSPSGRYSIVYPLNRQSTLQQPPDNKNYDVILTIANSNSLLPAGTYKIRVSVNLTPQ